MRVAWATIRKRELERANEKCEICGSGERLQLHELWRYDDTAYIQKLERYLVLCNKCHAVYHLGRASVAGVFDESLDHMVAVNRRYGINLSRSELKKLANQVFMEWSDRTWHKWRVDVSAEKALGNLVESVNDILSSDTNPA